MFMGHVSPSLLPGLVAGLPNEMLQSPGNYEVAEPKAVLCRLSVTLWFSDDTQGRFVFDYGSASEGPPQYVAAFVRHAVSVTDPWYHSQKAMVTATLPVTPRQWWQFWK
jgi:hypothetical protein